MRKWFEVRVREHENGKDVKKSRFFNVNTLDDARKKYKGSGTILTITKASEEQILGVGEFFRLGDLFLNDLRGESREKELNIPPAIVREVKNGARF
jgi:hypothetical protein